MFSKNFLILMSVDDSKDNPTTLLYGIRFIFALIDFTSLTSILACSTESLMFLIKVYSKVIVLFDLVLNILYRLR